MPLNIAVVGAGVAGVCTAWELAADGHRVTVFERRASVAEEGSFAHPGLQSLAHLASWAVPAGPQQGWRPWRWGSALQRAGLNIGVNPSRAQRTWLRERRSRNRLPWAQARRALAHLASFSRDRQAQLVQELGLVHEHSAGALWLLPSEADLQAVRPTLALLAEWGLSAHLVSAERARALEPGLSAETALRAAVHVPGDRVGNARQFTHQLRAAAEDLGAAFRFHREITRIEPKRGGLALWQRPAIAHRPSAGPAHARAETYELFNMAVCCAAADSDALLPAELRTGMTAVHGASLTANLRERPDQTFAGPQSAVLDLSRHVTITRLGQRVRVAGIASLENETRHAEAWAETLSQALHAWFPGCAAGPLLPWFGARAVLPDGLPAVGPTQVPGLWLNTGLSDQGWALACGAGKLVADLLAERDHGVHADLFTPRRLES